MQDAEILQILKIDLQISTDSLNSYLTGLIETTKERLRIRGITLENTESDGYLIKDYAAYVYRQRHNPDEKFPRFLSLELNNRLFSEKAGVDNG